MVTHWRAGSLTVMVAAAVLALVVAPAGQAVPAATDGLATPADRTAAAPRVSWHPSGPYSGWYMDAGAGNTLVTVGSQSVVPTIYGATWVTGWNRYGIGFDGRSTGQAQYVKVPWTFPFNEGGAASIAFWIKPAGTAPSYEVVVWSRGGFGASVPDAERFVIGYGANNDFYLEEKAAGRQFILSSSGGIDPTGWSHVAITRAQVSGGFDYRLYVDGSLRNSRVTDMPKPASLGEWYLGRRGDALADDPMRWFQGTLDEMYTYYRALTPAEIATMASGGPAPAARPGKVTGVRATPTRGRITVTWRAATGSPTRYTVQVSTNARVWKLAGRTSGSTTRLSWTRGRAGVLYYFRVAASSSAGSGPWSATVRARFR